ncbi:hypothetical protein PCAR4_1210031 [Paraburkholderia caribensis]|nr:hypothetical protein PCAR4_1210031 [Paraburkholderia caribensis]
MEFNRQQPASIPCESVPAEVGTLGGLLLSVQAVASTSQQTYPSGSVSPATGSSPA